MAINQLNRFGSDFISLDSKLGLTKESRTTQVIDRMFTNISIDNWFIAKFRKQMVLNTIATFLLLKKFVQLCLGIFLKFGITTKAISFS